MSHSQVSQGVDGGPQAQDPIMASLLQTPANFQFSPSPRRVMTETWTTYKPQYIAPL